MDKLIIDFSKCKTNADIHKCIKKALNLPDWYGENLDALWDCLLGFIALPKHIVLKYIKGKDSDEEFLDNLKKVKETFLDAEKETSSLFIEIEEF